MMANLINFFITFFKLDQLGIIVNTFRLLKMVWLSEKSNYIYSKISTFKSH